MARLGVMVALVHVEIQVDIDVEVDFETVISSDLARVVSVRPSTLPMMMTRKKKMAEHHESCSLFESSLYLVECRQVGSSIA